MGFLEVAVFESILLDLGDCGGNVNLGQRRVASKVLIEGLNPFGNNQLGQHLIANI